MIGLIVSAVQFLFANYQMIVTASVGVCLGLIAIFTVIPGDQPEKFLQSVVDFLKKISVKKL